jgi:hypothetical protein
LSESFWQEIQAHPIPVDVRVVRELTNIPGCLDLYMWLCWRCHHAKRTESVPLFGDFGLASQLGVYRILAGAELSQEAAGMGMKLVKLYWPDCPVRFSDDGTALLVSPGQAIAPMQAIASVP